MILPINSQLMHRPFKYSSSKEKGAKNDLMRAGIYITKASSKRHYWDIGWVSKEVPTSKI